ncbi:hypothetical protein LTR66_016738 [Elasticomyces elasticus]|nr:hypothetical protein LTR66_016738 [Elasticomyces elasticus]
MAEQEHSIKDIISMNGLAQMPCQVFWHDARPDYNGQSTRSRRELVVKSAIGHVHAALKLASVIVNQAQVDDKLFFHALRDKLDQLQTSLVIIPNDALSRMNWVASLDGRVLSLLNNIQIDIVIQPGTDIAGGLLRLLNSLQAADYAGFPVPRIIIDMPPNVSPVTQFFLENFHWPKDRASSDNKLMIYQRMNSTHSHADSVSRSMELFYPSPWPMSHVLVLSTDVELSPQYYQYLMYMLLEYKYGKAGQHISQYLMGMTLDSFEELSSTQPFILSQKGVSKAALYFGDKWKELRQWTALRLKVDPALAKSIGTMTLIDELMRTGTYFMLCPAFTSFSDFQLATIHTEVSANTEDYMKEPVQMEPKISALRPDTILTDYDEVQLPKLHEQAAEFVLLPQLIAGGKHQARNGLPDGIELSLFDTYGKPTTWDLAQEAAYSFNDRVSLELGDSELQLAREEVLKAVVGVMVVKGEVFIGPNCVT